MFVKWFFTSTKFWENSLKVSIVLATRINIKYGLCHPGTFKLVAKAVM